MMENCKLMKREIKHKINWLMRIVFISISLFVFQSSVVIAFPCQAAYNINAQNFDHSALLEDDCLSQRTELHSKSLFVLFCEVSEPENTHFVYFKEVAAKGGVLDLTH